MKNLVLNNSMTIPSEGFTSHDEIINNLSQAIVNQDYIIKKVDSESTDIANFLFTLGCFKGETITLISVLSDSYVVSIKDARYSIGSDLAEAIII